MFRYETISSHDGKYKLSALIKEEGYVMTHFQTENSKDCFIEDESYMLETFIPDLQNCIVKDRSYYKDCVSIKISYIPEILEMFEAAKELGYFANVNQEKL